MITKFEHNTVFVGIKKRVNANQTAINIRGSGVIVENGRLVTCAHVYNEVPDQDKNSFFCGVPMRVIGHKTEYQSFDLVKKEMDIKNDIAVFEIKNFDYYKTQFGFKKTDFMTNNQINGLKRTNKIYFIGFPLANEFLQMNLGITLSASECIVGAMKYRDQDDTIDFILIDKLVNPGNSGSPVYKGKKIIGLASGTFNQAHKIGDMLINVPVSIGIIRPANYIRELI
ncbi:MAG: serine protease [Patescibacteria group bacterium]|jgi:S1-C subfamily serine protease